jgi:hypothetical protein
MGILPQVATIILREHKHKPITGDLLLIGRQSVSLKPDEAKDLLEREGVPLRGDFLQELDTQTRGYGGAGFISDRSFFSMFTDARVFSLDVSDYEGAEIIHDLCAELPDRYMHVADFIYNGSCLDNLFDPARAMRSISKMLRPNGRMMDVEHGTPRNGAFICYSPEWFFDFFAVNNYMDCQTLVCKFHDSILEDWRVHWWRPYALIGGQLCQSYPTFREDFVTVVLAEKKANSSDDKTPIQGGYRLQQDAAADAHYVERYLEYLRSPRCFGFDKGFNQVAVQPNKVISPKEVVRGVVRKAGFDIKRGGRWGYKISKRGIQPKPEHNQVAAPFVGTLRGVTCPVPGDTP